MNWLREASELDTEQFVNVEEGQDDPDLIFETFTWDFETKTSKREMKSQSDILDINKDDASLVLVAISAVYEDSVGTTRDGLMALLDHFGIDRRVMLRFQCQNCAIHQTPNNACSARYVATRGQKIAWSEDPSHRCIRGIFFHVKGAEENLEGEEQEPGESTFLKTTGILDLELATFQSPSPQISTLFSWAALASVTTDAKWQVRQHWTSVGTVEGMTGHTVVLGATHDPKDVERLPEASKMASRTLNQMNQEMEDLSNYIAMSTQVILALGGQVQDFGSGGYSTSSPITSASPVLKIPHNPNDPMVPVLIESFEMIRSILQGVQCDLKWALRRAEVQMTLIDSLISHQDAETSNEIAKSSTQQADASYRIAHESKILAEQASQDAASMKTIAIMTMAFLPGTYIAALFAMPSLAPNVNATSSDDNSDRILSDFGLYWAISLPVTAAIIIVWYLLNRTEEQKRKERKMTRWIHRKVTSNDGKSVTTCPEEGGTQAATEEDVGDGTDYDVQSIVRRSVSTAARGE